MKYNLRKRKHINYNIDDIIDETEKKNNLLENKNTFHVSKRRKISYSFEDFNKIVGKEENSIKNWVSATGVKNYLMNDPVIDYFDQKIKFEHINTNKKTNLKNQDNQKKIVNKSKLEKNESLNILFSKGLEFEDKVIEYLETKYPGKVKTVINSKYDVWKYDKAKLTIDYIQKGIPIISQALLFNPKNKTFGVADLLIRSDWFDKLFNHISYIKPAEKYLKAPNLNGNYHYRVIDIKWTTLSLRADGMHILRTKRFPAYKGQLLIYNACLGLIQGYTPPEAYILGKQYMYKKKGIEYSGYNCFDRLGVIDFKELDNHYLDKTKKAIKWVRDVRYNNKEWVLSPIPSRKELYPNMCNNLDSPYHNLKLELAEDLGEITSLWQVGIKNREIAHNKNIFTYKDNKCTSKNLGIFGKKKALILDKIIEMNKPTCTKKIHPNVVVNNFYDWQSKSELDFYVDFETLSETFSKKKLDLNSKNNNNSYIFMIGVGYENSLGNWVYKDFTINFLHYKEEERIIDNFVNYIELLVKEYMVVNNIKNREMVIPRIIHWGHIERTQFSKVNKKYNNKWDKWKNSIYWLDMNEVFRSEPIVVRGMKNFGLKEVTKRMKNEGLIEASYNTDIIGEISNGLTAMTKAVKYYENLADLQQFMDKEYSKEFIENKKKEIIKDKNLIEQITNYNEIDCKVMWEILEYLRNNHIEKLDINKK